MPRRPPPRPPLSKQFALAIWGTWMRKTATIASFVGAIGAAIVSTDHAWPMIEPHTFTTWGAMVAHVKEKLTPLQTAQNQQAVSMDRFLLYNLKKDLDAAHRDPAARTSPIVQERIEDLRQQQNEAEERIRKATGGR